MYTLMGNSVAGLLTAFQDQVGQTPGRASIQRWGPTAAVPSEETTEAVEQQEEEMEVAEEVVRRCTHFDLKRIQAGFRRERVHLVAVLTLKQQRRVCLCVCEPGSQVS